MNLILLAETAAQDAAKKADPTLWETVVDNALYVLSFFGIIVAMFLISFALERANDKKHGLDKKQKFFTTKKIAVIGILSAMAAVLMILDFPIPLIPGDVYKFDFSELPIMIVSFAYGPATGVVMEFVKIVIKLLIKGTSTAFIGELANFVVGCSYVIPAATIYMFNKTKKRAVTACIISIISITAFSIFFNWLYLIPAFVRFFSAKFNIPEEAAESSIVGKGTKANSWIVDIKTFILYATIPFNFLKGLAISIITVIVYKPLSRLIKSEGNKR
ncbi:MAG: ECF transporter S component [Lachnospiraceae bacterium]|nr:ECF transporter S component [Lachnospiraceae bacterium]